VQWYEAVYWDDPETRAKWEAAAEKQGLITSQQVNMISCGAVLQLDRLYAAELIVRLPNGNRRHAM
jgi:hypothetical protein